MCKHKHKHELCQYDLRELSKHEVNLHYFEFVRNATKEEREVNGISGTDIGVYKCRICGDTTFCQKGSFRRYLKVCKNNCNGIKKGRSNVTVIGYNDLATTYSEYIKYFVNMEDIYTHTYSSNNEVDLKCPECGHIKQMRVSTLIEQGFSCSFCSNGISYPERLMDIILDKLNIDYSKQLTYDNGKHRYDFYVKNWGAIFETHGMQHYEQTTRKGARTLEEEQTNDEYKYNDAINNGIKEENYHQIDCRYSTLEWCRPNIEKALSSYVNIAILTDESWKEADIKAQKSIKIEVCKYWTEQKEANKDLTVLCVAKEFKASVKAIRNYLRWGTENGLCVYSGEEESKANNKRNSKFVYLIKPNGEKWFNESMSQTQLAEISGISLRTINICVTNRKPLSGINARYDKKYVGSYIILDETNS